MKYPNDPMHPLQSIDEIVQSYLVKDTPLIGSKTIPEFFAGQEIFITGGTGFVGKALIEKLLRSCPDIETIYVLMRPKKGKSIEERLEEIISGELYIVLRTLNSEFSKKLVPIQGDVTELKLGLSEADVKRMEKVSIIFHSAATVRFDDPLKHAIISNVRGTREVMKFAETLKNIKAVMHVSTTYSNVYTHVLEEKLYPEMADWEKTIEICEKLDEETLDYLTEHYINFMPNTYVFSKNLAENVTNSYKDKLPVIVYRPSMVVWALKEPIPGWVDNLNGPMGILLVTALGISRTMYCDKNNTMDMIPIDTCVKGMIIAAWKKGLEPKGDLSVYNSAAGKQTKVTIQQLLDIGFAMIKETPPGQMIWAPGGRVTTCRYSLMIRVIFTQIIPSLIIDFVYKMRNQKEKLMKIQRKMFESNRALSYFVTHNWDFKNQNFLQLPRCLKDEDLKAFDYKYDFVHDKILWIRYSMRGYRKYLMNEKDEDLPKHRRSFKIFRIMDRALARLFYLVVFYYIFIKNDFIYWLKDNLAI